MKTLASALCVLGFVAIIMLSADGQSAPPPAQVRQPSDAPPPIPAGAEIEARGPVHEAFAQPALPRQTADAVVPKKPPEPVNELPPDRRPEGDNVQWIPGYWAWDDDRTDFLWVSGTWRSPPPGRHWAPGYWQEAEGGSRWVPGYWAVLEETSVELVPAPPDPIEEAVPVAPDDNSSYVPGVWVYRQSRFWWRPGFWVGYRPGWAWITAGYHWTPAGYVFVDGYWDYDLERRGLCFAPVYLDRRSYGQPGWFYRPAYAVVADVLLTSLFVNVGRNQYYFGDYYDGAYARRGIYPLVDYRIGNRSYDPLFSYYRWQNRSDPRWEETIRKTYAARRDGGMPRPPRTLVLQQKSTTNVTMVASLNQINQIKTTNIKLQAVPPAQIQTIQKQTEHLREVTKKRASAEVSVRASSKGTEVHTPVRVELPKPAEIHKAPVGAHAPPPRPTHPEPVQKSPPPPSPKGKAIEPKGKVIEKGGAEFKKPAASEIPAAPKGKPEPPAGQKGKPEPPAAPKGKSDKKDKDNPAAQAHGTSGVVVASTQVDETPQIIVRWDDPLPGRRFQYNRRFPDIRTERIDVDDSL
jgi:WXXGXW repeat (2 copies)